MRVAITTESFLPQINGVTNSVLRVSEFLRDNGHEAIIIAPHDQSAPQSYAGFPVIMIPSVNLPIYHDFKVGFTPGFVLDRFLIDFAPDVIHVAAPFIVGGTVLETAARLAIPSVAIYQTDVPSYAGKYGLSFGENIAWTRVRDIHSLANLTLAPSSSARRQLISHGIPRVKIWGRGVDTHRFDPAKHSEDLHHGWAPDGEVVIGYMGRLAAEKQVSDLTVIADLEGTKLIIVGEGPSTKALKAQFPKAIFLGKLEGDELATALASMDIFVHPGELETFGQSIQEALASGLPVLAPAKGGPIDLVQSGKTGYLYPPGDLEILRDRAKELVCDKEERHTFSRAAREFTSHRTWADICTQLIGYYDEVIATTSIAGVDPR